MANPKFGTPLEQMARKVDNRQQLAEFVRELLFDLENNRGGWENKDLPRFLEAMAAWIGDMDGYYANTGQTVTDKTPWAIFADMLMAARVYE